MKINIHEPYYKFAGFCQYPTAETQRQINTQLAQFNFTDYWELNIEQLDALAFKSFATRRQVFNLPEHITVLQHFWFANFLDFLENTLLPTMEKLKTPDSLVKNYERQARTQLLKTSFTESMLIFARNYFNLPSFEQASHVPLHELILAYKDKTNSDIFQRAVNQLQMRELKSKRK